MEINFLGNAMLKSPECPTSYTLHQPWEYPILCPHGIGTYEIKRRILTCVAPLGNKNCTVSNLDFVVL